MGENGLLFKLKIGSEKEIEGEAERESAPLESTYGVRADGDFAVFTSGNLSFFSQVPISAPLMELFSF